MEITKRTEIAEKTDRGGDGINKMEFAKRIGIAISSSGITQKEIAKTLGISPGNIPVWKKGDAFPSIPVLYALCKLLNVSADYLLGL